jgi:hypothetical protein
MSSCFFSKGRLLVALRALRDQGASLWPKGLAVVNEGWDSLVEAIHRFLDSMICPGLDGLHGLFHHVVHDRPLGPAERVQDVVHHVRSLGGAADAEPETGEGLGVQVVDDRVQAFVASCGALSAEA